MTGISFDINVGRAVLEGHFDSSLGRLHEIHLNKAQESSFYPITMATQLVLFKEMIATYFRNRKKHIDTLCEKSAENFYAEAGDLQGDYKRND
jgi:hypothetical protein